MVQCSLIICVASVGMLNQRWMQLYLAHTRVLSPFIQFPGLCFFPVPCRGQTRGLPHLTAPLWPHSSGTSSSHLSVPAYYHPDSAQPVNIRCSDYLSVYDFTEFMSTYRQFFMVMPCIPVKALVLKSVCCPSLSYQMVGHMFLMAL